MRIVTWNLKRDKAADVWPRLQSALNADIVLLQEARKPDCCGSPAWENVPGQDWGSAVLVTQGKIRSITIEGYEGWCVGGELIESGLNANGRPLFVFSLHAPTGNSNQPRGPYVDEVVAVLNLIHASLPSDADLVLGGDFNFLSLGERKEGESLQTTPKERDALEIFKDRKLVSCWQAAHPGRPLPQTLRWSGDKTPDKSTPYHCDGIFIPQAWSSPIFCEVLTSACFEVSDHYPVAAWICQ